MRARRQLRFRQPATPAAIAPLFVGRPLSSSPITIHAVTARAGRMPAAIVWRRADYERPKYDITQHVAGGLFENLAPHPVTQDRAHPFDRGSPRDGYSCLCRDKQR